MILPRNGSSTVSTIAGSGFGITRSIGSTNPVTPYAVDFSSQARRTMYFLSCRSAMKRPATK